jgi:toxin ParE1/3/4
MTIRIIVRPRASQDLDDHFAYIAENNFEAALQFFDSVRLTFAQIARMPGLGSIHSFEDSRLQGLQKWAVKGFRKHLIFYFADEDAIEVVRILYATRDIRSILDGEEYRLS